MAAGGIKTVRFDATWATAEPTRPVRGHHRYAWRTFDDIAAALARHGLRWQPVLAYATPWASATLRAIDDGSVGPPGADQPCWGPGLRDFGEL
jgi:hypothetical protein